MAVTCHDVHEALRAGRELRDDAARAHIAECEACAALAASPELPAALAAAAEPVPPGGSAAAPGAVWARVEAESGRLQVRRLPTAVRSGLVVLATVTILGLVLALVPRHDLWTTDDPALALWLGALGLVLAGAVAVRQWPLHRAPLRPAWVPGAVTAVALGLPLGLALVAGGEPPVPGHYAELGFWSLALACFVFGSVTGLGVLVLLELADRRRQVPLRLRLLSAAALGLVGNLALQLHCSVTAPAHLLLGHAIVGAAWALGIAGGLLGLSRRRAAAP